MKYLTIFLLLFSFLAACGRAGNGAEAYNGGYPPAEAAPYPPDTPYFQPSVEPAPPPEPPCPRDGMFTSGRTRGEYLDDLHFLYNTLLENYPFVNVLWRTRGICLYASYSDTRAFIETVADFETDAPFMRALVNRFTNTTRGIGHLSVLLTNSVRPMIHAYLEAIERQGITWFQPFLDEFDNPATRALFDLTDADFILPPPGTESAVYVTRSQNIITNIIEEGRIAYVEIRTMSLATMEIDRLTLLEFFHQVADYAHLIIDIRRNGGGTGTFFPELIMAPNISETLRFTNYMFFTGGAHSRYMLRYWFDENIRLIDPDVFARLPYFHPDDISLFKYYMYNVHYIEPTHGEGIFNGKIWLLVGPGSFSSASNAAAIAKQTGFATLVGLTTGGGGVYFAPLKLALPNTGIILRYAAIYGTDLTGRESYEHGTEPHILNRPGRNALQTVLALIDEGDYLGGI